MADSAVRDHDIDAAFQNASVGFDPVHYSGISCEHLERCTPGNTNETRPVRLRGHDAYGRIAMGTVASGKIGFDLIRCSLKEYFRDARADELRMQQIHTRIHDADDDPLARLYSLAIFQGEGRVGLMHVERFQTPLALERG